MLRRLLQSAAQNRSRRYNSRGIAQWQSGELAAAERTLRASLKLDPRHAGAASNLGMVLAAQGRFDEAVDLLRMAVERDPDHPGARVNLAVLLHQGGGIPEAVLHLREALRIDPDNPTARANLLKPLMDLCDWPAVAVEVERLRDASEGVASDSGAWAEAIAPFESLILPFTPRFQLRVARRHAARYTALADMDAPVRRGAGREAAPKRLRIGYLSADFHDHATAHLTAGLYAAHDRARVEVTAYSIGHPAAAAHDASDRYRQRIIAGCDHFVDAAALSGRDLARRIADDGIDILLDMKGYTGGARPDVLARRPAPVQVSFLGYPGTMGAAFIDYLIADRVVIASGTEDCYSERLVFMPGSYQVNDDRQPIGEVPDRASMGLPPRGFVFCCFNPLYKTEPDLFAAWMRILAAVPQSVLWLQAGHALAEQRLRAAASAGGIDPARLVFAPYAPKPAHLARHSCAGLFLDTHVVNAHTAASDALWAGLPLLTWPGDTFASRVAASLLNAVGMPDGVMGSLVEYERTAIELATQPDRLAELKQRLAQNLATCPLFDTAAYARALENAYARMWDGHGKGRPAASFAVEG